MSQNQNKISIKLDGSVMTTDLNQIQNVSCIYVQQCLGSEVEAPIKYLYTLDQENQIIEDVYASFKDTLDHSVVVELVRKIIELNDVSTSAIVLVSNSLDLKLSNARVNDLEVIFKKHLVT